MPHNRFSFRANTSIIFSLSLILRNPMRFFPLPGCAFLHFSNLSINLFYSYQTNDRLFTLSFLCMKTPNKYRGDLFTYLKTSRLSIFSRSSIEASFANSKLGPVFANSGATRPYASRLFFGKLNVFIYAMLSIKSS